MAAIVRGLLLSWEVDNAATWTRWEEFELDNHNGVLFTSESVTEGHPDKIADQISDAILDAALTEDPMSRVACETLLTTGLVIVAGGDTTKGPIDYARLRRRGFCGIGGNPGKARRVQE